MQEHLSDLEGATGIKVQHKSRDGRVRGRSGGVAIAFDSASCNFKQRQLKHTHKEHEIVSAVGRIGVLPQRVDAFAIYVPSNIKVTQLEELREALATEVAAAQTTYRNPLVVVGGDFNRRDFGPTLAEVDDLELVVTGPTRGTGTIDLVYVNLPEAVKENLVLPPLWANGGADSDHRCVYLAAELKDERKFDWVVRMRRTRNQARETAFAKEMKERDWSSLTGDVDQMTATLEQVIAEVTNKHFPLARVRKRSNESPFITRHIRRLWKRKVRLYKRGAGVTGGVRLTGSCRTASRNPGKSSLRKCLMRATVAEASMQRQENLPVPQRFPSGV